MDPVRLTSHPRALERTANGENASSTTATAVEVASLGEAPGHHPPVRLALFGVGRWGTHLLRNFLQHPQATVVAIADPSAARLATLPTQFEQIDGEAVQLTSDWQAALQAPGLEAVVVATPAVTHYELIRSALLQRLHVLAEKPLTLKTPEAIELCQLAIQQDRQLVVDHTYLFHPAVWQGKVVMQQGDLGPLRYGYATRTHLGPVRSDVDALWDLAIHDIAIFNHWLGESPCWVQAQGSTWLQAEPTALPDLVWVTLTYPSGFQAVIHLCWANPDKQRRLCVVGSQGTLVFDELAPAPLTILPGQLESVDRHFQPNQRPPYPLEVAAVEPLQQVCDHFLDCVQQHKPSWISSGWLGADLVEILVALSQSLQQGGIPIALQPIALQPIAEVADASGVAFALPLTGAS